MTTLTRQEKEAVIMKEIMKKINHRIEKGRRNRAILIMCILFIISTPIMLYVFNLSTREYGVNPLIFLLSTIIHGLSWFMLIILLTTFITNYKS